jgi:hypothetical protein
MDTLCKVEHCWWEDQCYLIYVYQDARSAFYTAEITFGPGDRIISDGRSMEDALEQLRDLLPPGGVVCSWGGSWAILRRQAGHPAWWLWRGAKGRDGAVRAGSDTVSANREPVRTGCQHHDLPTSVESRGMWHKIKAIRLLPLVA